MALIPRRGGKVGVVELFGTIGGSVKSSDYDRIFSRLAEDKRFKAVVLDIDSPGGAVPASDYIYRSVKKIAARKPVVANVRGVAASGGYYIACGAHKIVAIPGGLVGSIGVLSVRPVVQELLARVGVHVNVNKSGALKDMGAPWREPTPEEDQKIQELIDDSYATFISIVSESRKMDADIVRSVATGEVYWATKALELGLVDELGDLDRAIDLAVELSGAKCRPVHLRPRRSFRQRLFSPLADSLVQATSDEIDRRLTSGYFRY